MLVPCKLTPAVTAVNVSGPRYGCHVLLVPDGDSDLAARLPHHSVEDWCSVSDVTCSVSVCDEPTAWKGLCGGHYKRLLDGRPLDTPLRPRRKKGEPRAECSFPGCGRPVATMRLCKTHYENSRAGKPLEPIRGSEGYPERAALCAIPDCGEKRGQSGRSLLCGPHDLRKRKYGDPLAGPPIVKRIPSAGLDCSHPGCGEAAKRHGMCTAHYQRFMAGKPMDVPVAPRVTKGPYVRNAGTQCVADDCEDPATRKGMCEKHYVRAKRADKSTGVRIRASQADWRERTRERRRAQFREWEKCNPEKVSLRDRRSKARRRVIIGTPDPLNYERIIAEHGMVCHICGDEIKSFADLHFDHVIPLARGGPHSYENVRPSHKRCNLRKGAKLLPELLAAEGR